MGALQLRALVDRRINVSVLRSASPTEPLVIDPLVAEPLMVRRPVVLRPLTRTRARS